MTLEELLLIPYVSNGRSLSGCDCYGLVRLARAHLFNREMMPELGSVDGTDKRQITNAVNNESNAYKVVKPIAGAIATAWRGRLCVHVGIVINLDGRNMILESDSDDKLPRIVSVSSFEKRYLRVVYYDN